MKIFFNGKIENKEKVDQLLEPGFLFGWGVFEPVRIYNKRIPFLKEHLQRLKSGLNLIGIKYPDLDFKKVIEDLLTQNSLLNAYLRITVYKKRESTGIIVYAAPFEYYKDPLYQKGISADISLYRRHKSSLYSKVKSISYLEKRVSWLKAQQKGKGESLVLSEEGKVLGGSRSNLFLLLKNDKLITPSEESGAFLGITRKAILNIAKELDISVEEKSLGLNQVYACKEAFLTSALMEVMPLVACEDKLIGQGKPGKVSLKFLKEYRKLTRCKT